jgi:hypothetical protein
LAIVVRRSVIEPLSEALARRGEARAILGWLNIEALRSHATIYADAPRPDQQIVYFYRA